MNRRVGLTGPVTIEIGGKARKFHVLHGTAGLVPEETEIATLVVQYSEGNPEELPIQYGVHVRDWWMWKKTENPTVGPGNQMVWQGENEYSKSKNCRIRVFASTF